MSKPLEIATSAKRPITTSDLQALREKIREENTKALSTAKKSLDHVHKCGVLLIELKATVKHGSFQHELKKLRIEQRTANNYMRIASKWKRVSDLNLGVRDAIKLLSIPNATGLATISDGIEVITIGTPPRTDKVITIGKNPRTEEAEHPPTRSSWVAKAETIDAEIVETPATTIRVKVTKPEDATPPAPAVKVDSSDPFLSIIKWLPGLSQDQFRELVNIIQTRWIK